MTTQGKQMSAGPWQMKEVIGLTWSGDPLYTVTRVVNRKRVHLEYTTDGKPVLWGEEQARAAIEKATGGSR